jgi:hypothetical protein
MTTAANCPLIGSSEIAVRPERMVTAWHIPPFDQEESIETLGRLGAMLTPRHHRPALGQPCRPRAP